MDVQLQVFGPRLLVQMAKQTETQTPSGVIAVASHDPGVIGTVMHCGEDVADVQVGDVVLFPPNAGQEMTFDGETFLVIEEEEVIAVWDAQKEPI